jgi:hypothetical protein
MSQFSNFQRVVQSSPGLAHNVSICVRAGLPKPRAVPDSERTKDTKTLDYASTPLDANTLLAAVFYSFFFLVQCLRISAVVKTLLKPLLFNPFLSSKSPVQSFAFKCFVNAMKSVSSRSIPSVIFSESSHVF